VRCITQSNRPVAVGVCRELGSQDTGGQAASGTRRVVLGDRILAVVLGDIYRAVGDQRYMNRALFPRSQDGSSTLTMLMSPPPPMGDRA
jgi:hypothetical protein